MPYIAEPLPLGFTWSPLAGLVQGLAKALQAMRAPNEIIQRYSVFVTNTLLIGVAMGALIWGVRFLVRILCRRPAISLGIPVHALAVGENGQLFAGTEGGVFRSNDNNDGSLPQRIWNSLSRFLLGDLLRRWQPVNADLTSQDGPSILIVKVKPGSRKDLGRPSTTPIENRDTFITWLRGSR